MPRQFDAFSRGPDNLLTFTGPGVVPFVTTGMAAEDEARRIGQSAPLALTTASSGLTSDAGPLASGVPVSRSDAMPDYSGPPRGANGVPGALTPLPPQPFEQPVPEGPPVSQAPKEENMSRRPEMSFPGDAPPRPTTAGRRFGPGEGGAAGGQLDASGGWGGVANELGLQRLRSSGGGSAAVPAHWQNTTRSTAVTDGRVGERVMGMEKLSAEATGAAGEAVRTETQAVEGERLSKEAQIEADAATALAARQEAARVERADIRGSMQSLIDQAAEPDVNPGQWWGDKTTGQTILLGLASGAIGMANGRAGIAGNPVMSGIERAIERDIENQVRNKDAKERNKAAKYQRLGQIYDLAKRESDDDVAAMHAAKLAGLTVAQKQIQAAALKSDSPLASAQGRAAYAAIDQRKADLDMAEALRLQKQVQGGEAFIPARAAGGGIDKLKLAKEMAEFNAKFAPAAPKPGESRGEMVIGGKLVTLDPALSTAEAEKARAGATFLHLADQQFAEAERLRGGGIAVADSDVQSALKSGSAYLSKAQDMGVVTGGEWDVTKEIYRGAGSAKALTQVRDTIKRHAVSHEMQYGADKRGQLLRQQQQSGK